MDDSRERLKRLLVRYAIKNSSRILSSGFLSNYFIEVRRVTLSSVGAFLIGDVFLQKMRELNLHPKALGGTESAIAIAVAVARSSYDLPQAEHIDVYTLRRFQKEYGTRGVPRQLLDGFQQKDVVVVVEDVTTNGTTTLKTVQKVKATGLKVAAVISLVDREEGAIGLIRPVCPFHAIFTAAELFKLRGELTSSFEYNTDSETRMVV